MSELVEVYNNTNKIISKHIAINYSDKATRKNLNQIVVGGSGAGKSRFVVKPQMFDQVIPTIQKHLKSNHLIISIAAGKSLDYLHENLGANTPIFRVMPNINATIGASTSCFSTQNASEEQKSLVEQLFSTVGTIVELPENLFSIFTTIGCASPAFTYLLIFHRISLPK